MPRLFWGTNISTSVFWKLFRFHWSQIIVGEGGRVVKVWSCYHKVETAEFESHMHPGFQDFTFTYIITDTVYLNFISGKNIVKGNF